MCHWSTPSPVPNSNLIHSAVLLQYQDLPTTTNSITYYMHHNIFTYTQQCTDYKELLSDTVLNQFVYVTN